MEKERDSEYLGRGGVEIREVVGSVGGLVTKWPETATACMWAVLASWGYSADMSSSN